VLRRLMTPDNRSMITEKAVCGDSISTLCCHYAISCDDNDDDDDDDDMMMMCY